VQPLRIKEETGEKVHNGIAVELGEAPWIVSFIV
jgi:hypothetical protein